MSDSSQDSRPRIADLSQRRDNRPTEAGWRQRLYDVIFEAETPLGKGFDLFLLILIISSVVAVCLETVESITSVYRQQLFIIEWIFTVVFTVEYGMRIACVRNRSAYLFSFFGVIDLLAIVPSYINLFLTIDHVESLLAIRAMRLLRVFRVLKMGRYIREGSLLLRALHASRRKIIVFLFTVLTTVVVIGAAMYLIEGSTPGSKFTSIPKSMYWAIVTLTTVGYGDISPQTVLGQALSSLLMIFGYGIIAVPTGIVSVELAEVTRQEMNLRRRCECCGGVGHDMDATFCKHCGSKL